jgi:hypothetical protein
MRENSQVPVAGPRQGDPRLTLGLAVAVLSGRHPGHTPFERLDLEALAGEVLLIKDPFHFAIDSGLLCVVATAVVDDLEDFEGEVFRLTLARESARAAPQSDATSISRRASDGKGRPKHKYCARPTAELSITPLPSPFAAQGHVRVPGLHRFLQRQPNGGFLPGLQKGREGSPRQVGMEEAKFVITGFARQKCPHSIDFEADLPQLPTGKLYKRVLRDRYWKDLKTRIV